MKLLLLLAITGILATSCNQKPSLQAYRDRINKIESKVNHILDNSVTNSGFKSTLSDSERKKLRNELDELKDLKQEYDKTLTEATEHNFVLNGFDDLGFRLNTAIAGASLILGDDESKVDAGANTTQTIEGEDLNEKLKKKYGTSNPAEIMGYNGKHARHDTIVGWDKK